ncbi:S-layer homology domain-containing protein [Peribacillus acanthi]|uniref:S-layer homology domain-containing protein n=1 Tax=Peribacillus acanthi TaxID=2171554 RepID=UPI000D3EBE3F|nr:S-layer homology domain-containing protein [Peribacillus acanthi]
MRKLASLFLSFALLLSLLPAKSAFADDITGIKLEKEMRAMIEAGIIYGYGPDKYAPGDEVTRGQFATFLARALKLPEGPHVFTDVAITSNLAFGINAAAQSGIVTGLSGGKFGPDQPVTREQMAVMINKSLDYLKISKTAGTMNFSDNHEITSSISKWAITYMVGSGIIMGIPNEDGTFRFAPKKTATRAEAAAFIARMITAAEKDDEESNPDYGLNTYRVSTVSSDGKITIGTKQYGTFAEADKAITNASTQVITYNDKIIKMSSGIVISVPTVKEKVTLLYTSDALKTHNGGVEKGTELQYISSDEKKVVVKIAGKTAYIKHEEANLVPKAMMKGRSYYSVNASGELVHHLYQEQKNNYVAYVFGKAPSFLEQGKKYYSWDGSNFTNENGAAVGTQVYQYFSMLPARTKTNYTAEEIDTYIAQKLIEKENLYNSDPVAYIRYKDATKLSKLIGIGSILKEFEKTYKINGLMVLGIAINESDFGMSPQAQVKNNIIGLYVYDSDPTGKYFTSIQENITTLATSFLNKNYIPLTGAYANGGMLGNKAKGINVRYASDPYWGQKAAGHIFKLDKELGGKDLLNNPTPYKIGLTTANDLKVRNTPVVETGNIQFAYPTPGYPVAILANETRSDGSIWHQILSDSNENEFGYTYSLYVKELSYVK